MCPCMHTNIRASFYTLYTQWRSGAYICAADAMNMCMCVGVRVKRGFHFSSAAALFVVAFLYGVFLCFIFLRVFAFPPPFVKALFSSLAPPLVAGVFAVCVCAGVGVRAFAERAMLSLAACIDRERMERRKGKGRGAAISGTTVV